MAGINRLCYAKLIKYIIDQPATVHDLAAETGLHFVTVGRLMRMFKQEKIVHICGWEPDSRDRDVTAVYKFGEGRDKAKRRISSAVRTKNYRERQKIKFIPTSTLPVHQCAG